MEKSFYYAFTILLNDAMDFLQQSQKAKEFYEQSVLQNYVERTANSLQELNIMLSKLAKYGNLVDATFIHIGAGEGRFVAELATVCNASRNIAIDIADHNVSALNRLQSRNSHLPIEIIQHDFFELNFSPMADERAFVFMNWSIISECGSREGVLRLMHNIMSFKRVVIIGDMPLQEQYLGELIENYTKLQCAEIGMLEAPFKENEKAHRLYIPSIAELYALIAKLGFQYMAPEYYHSASGQKRYFFEFWK